MFTLSKIWTNSWLLELRWILCMIIDWVIYILSIALVCPMRLLSCTQLAMKLDHLLLELYNRPGSMIVVYTYAMVTLDRWLNLREANSLGLLSIISAFRSHNFIDQRSFAGLNSWRSKKRWPICVVEDIPLSNSYKQ